MIETKSKIMLLFPDGVGIRNYLYSDVFKGMENELVLFHAFDTKTEQVVKDILNEFITFQTDNIEQMKKFLFLFIKFR